MISQIPLRWRIAAVTVLLTLALLFSVVWLAQDQLLKSEREERITTLCLEVRRMALNVRPESPIQSMTQSMSTRLRVASVNDLLIHWENFAKAKVWESVDWPSQIDREKLSWGPVLETAGDEVITAKGAANAVRCQRAEFSIGNGVRDGNWMAISAKTAEGYGFVAIDMKAVSAATYLYITKPLIAFVAPISLGLSLLVAWLLSAFTMRPIDRLARNLADISLEKTNQRLSLAGSTPEFRVLIESYNEMLSRLEKNYEQVARFSADAAHELKTPLTILRGQIEQALRNPEQTDNEKLLLDLQSQVSNLSAIIRKLLLLAQADSGYLLVDKKPVNWTALLNSALDDASILCVHQKIQNRVDDKLQVVGDEVILIRLCANLLMNALLHGLPTGRVQVSARLANNGVETIVTNDCDPISQAERSLFFDRFYRRHEVRQRGVNGSGLGLSLAREIARAHGGDLTLLPSADDVVSFCLWLPSA